ncbi:MAG TPA: hypothetical protein DCR40_16760 [Prolixibacteraceae bacterium]|nr:hypothetical protein [Prolixibacteraceae bacterium]
MRLIQTDFQQQSLVLMPRTKYLILEAIESMLHARYGSVELRDEAITLSEFLGNSENQDNPTLFQKSCSLSKCPDCAGSGQQKNYPMDRNDDVQFLTCPTCQGSGQLYTEIIRKGYVPTEFHRRKFAK